MARRVPPTQSQDGSKQEAGGASGAPEDHEPIPEALTTITIPGQASSKAKVPAKPVFVRVRRYEVVRGGRAMLDGALVPIQQGRIIHETHYDIDRLRAQNILLQELPPTPEEEKAMEAEAKNEAPPNDGAGAGA